MGLAKECLRSSQRTSAKTKAKKSENKDKRGQETDARTVGLRVVELTTAGQRNQMTEVGLFTVANGKIVKEVYLGLVGTSRQNKES